MTLIRTTRAGLVRQHDMYTDGNGRRFIVQYDADAEDPRSWANPSDAAVVVIDGGRHASIDAICDYDGNPAIELLISMLDEAGSDDPMSISCEQWRQALADRGIDYSVGIRTFHGYAKDDWFTAIAAVRNEPGNPGDPERWLATYRMWAFGDVWMVAPDNGDDIGSMGNIYASIPGEAVRYYVQHSMA